MSADGKLLASGGSDGTVKLWNLESGNLLRTLEGNSGEITSVAISSDGTMIASADKTNEAVTLWDTRTGKILFSRDDRGLVAFSPNGQMIACARINSGREEYPDPVIDLIDVKSKRLLRRIKLGEFTFPSKLIFSPDGEKIAAISGRHSWGFFGLKVWNVSDRSVIQTIKSRDITSFIFTPDSKGFVTTAEKSLATSSEIKLWDLASGKVVRQFIDDCSFVGGSSLDSNGKVLATINSRGEVRLWDATSSKLVRTLHADAQDTECSLQAPSSIAFVQNNKIALIDRGDLELLNLDTATFESLGTSPVEIAAMGLSKDGQAFATLNYLTGGGGLVNLWDLRNGVPIKNFEFAGSSNGPESTDFMFAPDLETCAFVSGDGKKDSTKLWDMRTGSLRYDLGPGRPLAFSTNGRAIACVYRNPAARRRDPFVGVIKIWNTANGEVIKQIDDYTQLKEKVNPVIPGEVIILELEAGGFYVFNETDGEFIRKATRRSTGQDSQTDASVLTADSQIHATSWGEEGLSDVYPTGLLRIEDLANGKTLFESKGTEDDFKMKALAFSPDGKTLATGDLHGTIKLREARSGKTVRIIQGHTTEVTALHFSASGSVLLSEGQDQTIKLWSVPRGELLASLIQFDTDSWIVITPEGFFDGPPPAWEMVSWRFSDQLSDVLPVAVFYSQFYRPGLFGEIMSGTSRKGEAKSILTKFDRRQPAVTIYTPAEPSLPISCVAPPCKVTVKVSVSELPPDQDHRTGSGAKDVRLFRNGSLVKLWQDDLFALTEKDGCKLQPQATPQSARHSVCTTTIPIVAGENELAAYAFNNDNIKSSDATQTVTGADSLRRKGTLHILAVGVSRYANREYNLDYISDDATSFTTQLKHQQEQIDKYESIEIKTLLDENAKKADILAELKKLATSVQPEDAVVVYFSGHGKASGDHFYLVPHDLGYTGLRDQLSDAGLRQILLHSISDLELEEAFRGIDAGQMFMIIDACNSGQALENKDEPRRGPMNTRGLAQLAYEKGMYIMTASQNVEEAFVSLKLKHSYLTFALVEEGLKTKVADADADRNGEVNLREWFNYASARVPKLREETLQSKSMDDVNPKLKDVKRQKSQTPRVFYRREVDRQPMIVANVGLSK